MRATLCQPLPDGGMDRGVGRKHAVGLGNLVVEKKGSALSIRGQTARFLNHKNACCDVPFPRRAKGHHGVKATFGHEAEPIGQ